MKESFVLILSLILSCTNTTTHHTVTDTTTQESESKITVESKNIDYSPPVVIIYKTKDNYDNRVPVILDETKTKIISYPAPADVYYNNALALPVKLSNGYLLDNRGITPNVAFLNITYEEYSKLKEVPSPDELIKSISEKSPLTEMYNLGNKNQYNNLISDINRIIENRQLDSFQRLY